MLNEYVAHFHRERNHLGKGNVLPFPEPIDSGSPDNRVECKQRLGGLLRYLCLRRMNKLTVRPRIAPRPARREAGRLRGLQ